MGMMGRIEQFLLKSARTDCNNDIVKEIIKDSRAMGIILKN